MTTFTVNLSEKELETILDALQTAEDFYSSHDEDSDEENEKDCQEMIRKLQAICAREVCD